MNPIVVQDGLTALHLAAIGGHAQTVLPEPGPEDTRCMFGSRCKRCWYPPLRVPMCLPRRWRETHSKPPKRKRKQNAVHHVVPQLETHCFALGDCGKETGGVCRASCHHNKPHFQVCRLLLVLSVAEGEDENFHSANNRSALKLAIDYEEKVSCLRQTRFTVCRSNGARPWRPCLTCSWK